MEQPQTLSPLGDAVIVEIVKGETQRMGAIEIPPTADPKRAGNQLLTGKIVAVGPGRWNSTTGERMPVKVAVGQKIMFGQQCADFKYAGSQYLAMKESNIAAIIE